MKLFVKSAYDEERNVELNYELPDRLYCDTRGCEYRKVEAKTEYYQRFKLQPHTYIFKLGIKFSKDELKDSHVEFLMKLGSVSKCTIEELTCEK